MKKKNILIVVGIILGISAATIISIKVNQKIREVEVERAAKMEKERKEEKIKKEEKERRKIALWCVQNLEGPKIKEIKVGSVTKLGIGGTGGASIDVQINNKKQNTIVLDLDGVEKDSSPSGGAFAKKCEYDFNEKSNNRTLEGIRVEKWKEH